MKHDEQIVFGAGITTALLFMLCNLGIRTPSDVFLWIAGGVSLAVVPIMVLKVWRRKIDANSV